MSPTVSVVMPACNAEATIGAAITSVLSQTYQDVEIIVVDDGSTDGTAARVQRFGDRTRLIRQERTRPAIARNRGVLEASGRFVAFLDADDLWLPSKLERQMDLLNQEPSIDAVQTGAYLVNDALQVVEVRHCEVAYDSYLDYLLFRNLPAFSSSVVIRKERFDALGGFSTDLIMETWDMACRLARSGTLRSIPEGLVLYRQHAGNRSRDVTLHIEAGFRSLTRAFADPTLDPAIRAQASQVWARFYAMLSGGYFRNRQWGPCVWWAWRAVRTSPRVGSYIAAMPFRRIGRAVANGRRLSFADELPFALSR